LHALIGRAFADQEVYSEALSHFAECYSLYHSLGRQKEIGYALLDRSDMLWRLGRYQEARDWHAKALAVTAEIDNKYGLIIQARLHLVDAWMFLSERNFPQARASGQQALALAGQEAKYTAIAARYTLAVASVHTGQGREAKRLCEVALDAPMDYQNQSASTRLAMAEVLLEIAKPTEALANALRARETFAHTAQIESVWRASYLAACASQQMNDGRAAREHAAQAESQLEELRQRWGDEAFNGYLNRQDVKFYRHRLDSMRASTH
jgi:tetratricopeptide (TPR) repeat protein